MITGIIGHSIAVQFIDLSLFACNSSYSIVIGLYLAYKYLGERFVPQYDITALILVLLGTFVIIFLSNKEQENFTITHILDLLTSVRSLFYFGIAIAGMVSVQIWMPTFLRGLRRFESDCEKWDDM